MIGIRVRALEVPGLDRPLSLRVPIGRVRAIVSPDRRVARAIADVITRIVPRPDHLSITGGAGDPPPDGDGGTGKGGERDGHAAGDGRVRLVPADGGLLPHLTVLDNIISTRRPAERRYLGEAEQEVRAKAADYGLYGLLDRYPHEIPVGRRRMAGLARALRAWPAALVLEDDRGLPTWGALLATAWRGYQVRPGQAGPAEPRTPDLLVRVATVLIVPTEDGARALDARPLVLDTGGGGRPDGT